MKRIFVTLTGADNAKVWINVDNIVYIKEKDPMVTDGNYNTVISTTSSALFVREDYKSVKKLMLDDR